MRNYLSIVLIFLSCACFATASQATDLSLTSDEMAAMFREVVTKDSPWPATDLEIKNFSSIPAQIDLPMGQVSYQILSQDHGGLLGQKNISLLLTIDGQPKAKVKMHGDVHRYGDIIITSRRLPRHTIISPDDLAVARRDLTMFAHDLIPSKEAAIGQRLTTNLRSGAVLFARNLKKMPLIERGDLVTIRASTKNLQVSVQGEARNQGAKDDTVRVKNLMSRKIIIARVVESGLVEVDF